MGRYLMRARLALLLSITLGACQSTSDSPKPAAPPEASPRAPTATPAAPPAAPSAPGSVRGRASAEVAAPFQSCTADEQCTVVGNGCCDVGGPDPGIGIRKDQAAAFKALFACEGTVCRTSEVVRCEEAPPCTRADCTLAELAGCTRIVEPVAKCVAGRCSYGGP